MKDSPSNVVGWFEIPVRDMERAMQFYQDVLGVTLDRHTMDSLDMAWFPMYPDAKGAAGSLVRNDASYTPSSDGTLVYFSSPSGDLQNELDRVAAAGGSVAHAKKPLGEHGFVGVVLDTEGNRIALHSMQ